MFDIDVSIIAFLKQQTCATICCSDEVGNPYCFTCYYSFNQEEVIIYFKSSTKAYHSILLRNNPKIAGTVLPDKLNNLKTKGVQFQGELIPEFHSHNNNAFTNYHKRHPLALGFSGDVYTIRIDQIKMTDSSMGFGKKTIWNRIGSEVIVHK